MRPIFAVVACALACLGAAASCSSFGSEQVADAATDAASPSDAADVAVEATVDAAVLPIGKTVDRTFTCASLTGRRVLLCKDFLEMDAGAAREGLDLDEDNTGSFFVEMGATPPENAAVTEVPNVSAIAKVQAVRTPAGPFVLAFDFDIDDFAGVVSPRPIAAVAVGAITMTLSASNGGLSVAGLAGVTQNKLKLQGGWHRLFARGEGQTVTFHVDGELVGQAAFASTANVAMTLGLGADGPIGPDALRMRFDNLVIVAD